MKRSPGITELDVTLPHSTESFAHESEREFAGLLDFYGIAWAYEPTTFVLERDALGRPTLAFSPDFFLPTFALYIELTTLRQSLVTKKNKKVRLLREQHPGLAVKILYRRDYLALTEQFGLPRQDNLAA